MCSSSRKRALPRTADVAVTAAMLPPNAQWVAYVSLRGYVQMIQRFMAAALKDSPQAEITLPDFAKSPPIGLAFQATPTELGGGRRSLVGDLCHRRFYQG